MARHLPGSNIPYGQAEALGGLAQKRLMYWHYHPNVPGACLEQGDVRQRRRRRDVEGRGEPQDRQAHGLRPVLAGPRAQTEDAGPDRGTREEEPSGHSASTTQALQHRQPEGQGPGPRQHRSPDPVGVRRARPGRVRLQQGQEDLRRGRAHTRGAELQQPQPAQHVQVRQGPGGPGPKGGGLLPGRRGARGRLHRGVQAGSTRP